MLDDLDRARAHGDLVGSFGAVADKLTGALTKLGLSRLGAVGDHFDPAVHEAVQFGTSTEVAEPTVTAVFRSGYTLGEKLVRPAVVVVTGPEHEAAPRRRICRRGRIAGAGRRTSGPEAASPVRRQVPGVPVPASA